MTDLERLEKKREQLHAYVVMKLDERDYHGVADAAMDLRELEVKVQMLTSASGLTVDELQAQLQSATFVLREYERKHGRLP